MNSILVVVDPMNVNIQTIDSACYLSKACYNQLHIIFLGKDKIMVAPEVIEKIKEACTGRETRCIFKQLHTIDTEELLTYCLFADLMVLDPAISPKQSVVPTPLATFILHHAPCPVLLSPAVFEGITELVFPYVNDGSAIFALKQFTYLLPVFDAVKFTLLELLSPEEHSVYDTRLMEWINGYYTDVQQVTRRGAPGSALMDFLLTRQHALVVMGAFGGGLLKQLVHQSTAERSVTYTNHTFFIAHR